MKSSRLTIIKPNMSKGGAPPNRASVESEDQSGLPARLSYGRRFLAYMGALVIKGINQTLRWDIIDGGNGVLSRTSLETPRIFAVWHGHQLLTPCLYKRICQNAATNPTPTLFALSSMHRDGALAAKILNRLGVRTITGSSSRGGTRALRGLIRCLRSGDSVAITVDGPRGPIYRVKPGIIKLSQLTGAPISPVILTPERYWQINSWDEMRIPKPFTGFHVYFLPEFICPAKGDPDELAHQLQNQMWAQTTNDEQRYSPKPQSPGHSL
jgi:lysophospholipid acyltransferase (LPLAT)-like uncharacterized protein